MIFPTASLGWTSFIMCVIIFLLTLNKSRIINILGTVLTPFLLLSIAVIVIFAVINGNQSTPTDGKGLEAFTNGFFKGYQTMDLVASFFFSGFVISSLQHVATNMDEKGKLRLFLKASICSAILLYLVYFCLVLLGWLYAPLLKTASPQELFGIIAFEALGQMAGPCVCIAVIFACLTTAMALTALFADFLQRNISKNKIGNKTALLLTLTIAFLVSNLDFTGIASFLGPILEVIYPALITLTIVNIACKLCGTRTSHWPFTLTVGAKALTFAL